MPRGLQIAFPLRLLDRRENGKRMEDAFTQSVYSEKGTGERDARTIGEKCTRLLAVATPTRHYNYAVHN